MLSLFIDYALNSFKLVFTNFRGLMKNVLSVDMKVFGYHDIVIAYIWWAILVEVSKNNNKFTVIFIRYSFGLWCLTQLSTIFQFYRGGQFYWWRKPEYAEKTIDLPQASHIQTLSHNAVSRTPHHKRDSNFSGEKVDVNPTTMRSRPWRPQTSLEIILWVIYIVLTLISAQTISATLEVPE